MREHECIRHHYLGGVTETVWELHEGRKRESVFVGGAYVSNSVIISSQAAREHLGIAMLPLHLASNPAFGAGLVRVLPEWEGTKVTVFALSVHRVLPAKTLGLIRLVKADFARRVAQLEAPQ